MLSFSYTIDHSAVEDTPCPCGSGLSHGKCCGITGASALSGEIAAAINHNGKLDRGDLPSPVLAAIEQINHSPDLFPTRIDYDAGQVLLAKMSPRWYRESSFLEPNRIKGHCTVLASLDWLTGNPAPARWSATSLIFHTAFCGSTLMTRAVESLYHCMSLREPEPLSSLLDYTRERGYPDPAEDGATRSAYSTLFGLLSRSYHPEQGVLIKTSDKANALMPTLVNWRGATPVLFMYTPLSEFLAGCLRSAGRRQWIRERYLLMRPYAEELLGFGEEVVVADDAIGEMAALYWCYNLTLFYQAHEVASGHLYSLDFNAFLADPMNTLQATARAFGLSPLPDVDAAQALENVLGSYSKDTSLSYGVNAREAQIKKTSSKHPGHLKAGEALACALLGDRYPEGQLPGALA